MQVMPGMTQDQRKAAGNSYRQFQQRLFGNKQQPSGATMYAGGPGNFDERTGQYTQPTPAPVIGNAPNGRPVTGAVTTAQPTKAPDMSIYKPATLAPVLQPPGKTLKGPGTAQPKTTSQGTPYGQPQPISAPGTPYDGMRPAGPIMDGQRPPQPSPQPSFDWRSYFNQTPMVRESYEERFTPAPPPPPPEPPKFTSEFTQSMTGFGGRQSDPKQFYAQRDAFIQRLNEERGRQAAQAGVYGTGETPQFYRPSRDFGVLWGQAGDMVSNGWTNPLAGLFG